MRRNFLIIALLICAIFACGCRSKKSNKSEPAKDADYYFQEGDAFYRDSDLDKAIASYSKAIELKPKYAEAYYSRGYSYNRKHDYDNAIKDFSKAFELNQNEPKYRKNLGYAYFIRAQNCEDNKNLAGAIEDYENFLKVAPNNPEIERKVKALKEKMKNQQ